MKRETLAAMEQPLLERYRKEIVFFATLTNCISLFFAYHYSGLQGLLFICINILVIVFFDVLMSDAFAKNLKILNANGFTNEQVFVSMFLSFLIVGPMNYLVTWICFRETVIPYISHGLLIRVAIMLTVSETAFTYGHLALHQDLSKYHLMHHCCKYSSYTSNFVFHPLDLMMEFGMPLGTIILTNLMFFQDDWAAMVALTIATTLYTLDHDEYLQRPHSKHHSQLTSPYTAYFDSSMHIKDAVRPMVKSE
ncbi:hypothetical protein EDD86DRAFT_146559 [Gorgonomyces haynaldii]|nr:hypothetical protein EDD86DRAFT_146559 [Gorgonomyces haynaldii]